MIAVLCCLYFIWNTIKSSYSRMSLPNSSTPSISLPFEYLWNIQRINPSTWKYKADISFQNDILRNLTFKDAFSLFSERNVEFCESFVQLIRDFPSEALFFECTPITQASYDVKPFEFVLISSGALASIRADVVSFADYFKPETSVTSFTNLGKDATLIVPCKDVDDIDVQLYAHIANFFRSTKTKKILDILQLMGEVVQQKLNEEGRNPDKKLWISTSGLGVYWLHIRLDDKPKYYNNLEYK